jgi:hypothetical protein
MSYSSVCGFRNFRTELLKPPSEVVVFSNLTSKSSRKQSKQGILFIAHPPTLFSCNRESRMAEGILGTMDIFDEP